MAGTDLSQIDGSLSGALSLRPKTSPANEMTCSDNGARFIWMLESQLNVSCGVHAPSADSGVTIGPGYDMKQRSSDEIREFFTPILGYWSAATLSQATGLKGRWSEPDSGHSPLFTTPHLSETPRYQSPVGIAPLSSPVSPFTLAPFAPSLANMAIPRYHGSALMFCKQHDSDFCLSIEQQMKTLKGVVDRYEKIVHKAFGTLPLKENEFDALVSMAWNSPNNVKHIPDSAKKAIKEGDSSLLQTYLLGRIPKDEKVRAGIKRRHEAELLLFSKAIYEPASYAQDLQALSNWKCGTPGRHSHLPRLHKSKKTVHHAKKHP